MKRSNYGLDAPGAVKGLIIGSIAGFGLGVGLYFLMGPLQPGVAYAFLFAGLVVGTGCALLATGMFYGSKVGKLHARDQLIGAISWRGDEQVLDVGCGRGLLLIAAAKRLTTGRAIGVDIWSTKDLSDNRPEATWTNAQIEGVADRIQVEDGDVRRLPFPDSAFDVVTSSLVLHNLPNRAEREQAIREIMRVLKPSGRIAILDIAIYTGEYAQILRENDMTEVTLPRPFYLLSPFTRIVTARKLPHQR